MIRITKVMGDVIGNEIVYRDENGWFTTAETLEQAKDIVRKDIRLCVPEEYILVNQYTKDINIFRRLYVTGDGHCQHLRYIAMQYRIENIENPKDNQ